MKVINILVIMVALFVLVGCAQEADVETDDDMDDEEKAVDGGEDIETDDLDTAEMGDDLDTAEMSDDLDKAVDGNTSASPFYNTTILVEMLATHNSESDCWVVYDGSVYDITDFLPQHKTTLIGYCGTSEEFEDAFVGKHGTGKVSVLMEQGVLKGELQS